MNLGKLKEKFEVYIEKYINEIRDTHEYFELYIYISNSILQYNDEINIAPAFFSIVSNALLSNTIISLSKLYENYNGKKRSEKNIVSFLNFIESNIKIFPQDEKYVEKYNCPYKIDASFIRDHRNRILTQKTILDNLFTWRDKLYAHHDGKYFLKPERLGKEYPINVNEFRMLIGLAYEIINSYSIAYNGTNYYHESINIFDVDKILEILKAHNLKRY